MRQQYPDRLNRVRSRLPSSVSAPAGIETLEERRLFSSPLSLGINANNITSKNYKAIVKALQDSQTTSVRLWYGFDDANDHNPGSSLTFAKKFHNDGFDVMLAVVPRDGKTLNADETRSFFGWLVKQNDITKYVDRWEVGNEEDSDSYWKGSLKSYVSDYLAPASKVLHSVGETVVSGGVSWNPEDIAKLVDAGMLKWVDMVGYHPYRSSVSDLKLRIARVKEIVGDKIPLVASEWNVRGHEHDKTQDAWAHDVLKFWPVIRDSFYASYYFAATTQNSPAGPGGILNRDGSKHDPFYTTYMLFQRDPGAITGGDSGGYTGGTGDGNADGGGDDDDGGDTGGDDTGGDDNGGSGGGSDGGSSAGGDDGGSSTGGSKGGTSSGGSKGGSSSGGSKGGSSSGGSKGHSGSTPAKPQPAPEKPVKPVTPPILDGLTLFNANRQRSVRAFAVMSGVTTFDLADMGTDQLSLVAAANKKTASVKFTVDGSAVVDNDGDFTLFGEKKHAILGGTLRAHTYLVTAQAFSGENATGRASAISSYTITVTDSRPAAVQAAAADERRRLLAAAARRKHRTTAGGSVLDGVPT